MALVTDYINEWGCPDNLVDCVDGGFLWTWDDGGVSNPNPRDDCATADTA